MTSFGAMTDATFTDGQSARRHAVRVIVEPDGLHVLSEDGAVAETWSFNSLRLVDDVYANRPIRLKCGKGAARLTIGDTEFLDQVRPHTRRLRGKDLRRRNLWVRGAGWIGAAAGIPAGFWFLLPLAAEPVASAIPLPWEEGLGRSVQGQAVALLAGKSGTCRGKAGQRAIERVVARLAAVRKSRYTFRVTVVDSPIQNAFAGPGGYIVVFRGLIDSSPDANALTGVLAHEMGHVIERHGMEQLVKSVGLSIVIGALFGDTSSFGSVAAGIAQQLATRKFSRDAEREADRVAVTMLNKTNISGRGFQEFFRKLAAKSRQDEETGDQYFSSHPATGKRAEFIRKNATGAGNAMAPAEWRAVKEMCAQN